MPLSLVEVKEKLKPQVKSLWDVDDFKIVKAEHKADTWVLGIEYQKPTKGPAGVMEFYSTTFQAIAVNDSTGQIEVML